jgi:glutathione S-transferase
VIFLQTFANPEDSAPYKNLQPKFGDQDVERVRRAHRNDLENIFSFVIVAFFYVMTSPTAFIAVNVFRASAIARCVHSLAYAVIPMQPARFLSFMVCCVSTVYMAVMTMVQFL